MKNLYTLVLEFKDSLDKEEIIKNLKYEYLNLQNNKELVQKIRKYNYTKDEYLRKELLSSQDLRKIKHLENNMNYIILEINQELKNISNKGNCKK